jgi:ABC-type transporter lipoprotein component MlaA
LCQLRQASVKQLFSNFTEVAKLANTLLKLNEPKGAKREAAESEGGKSSKRSKK